jgi:hypothetical protein
MAIRQIQVRQENPIWDPVFSDAAKFGAVFFLYSSVTACFVSKLSEALILQAAAIGAVVLTVIAGIGERWAEQEESREVKMLCHRVRIVVFCMMDLMMRDLLTHELGHTVAAWQLYFKASPWITIKPFVGGITHYTKSSLTNVGKMLGKGRVSLLIAAAGPLSSFATSLSMIAFAHFKKKENPDLSEKLEAAAIVSIASHMIYAFSALKGKKDNGHDFMRLAQGGYHPLVFVISMLAIPVLLKKGLFYLEENPEN